MVTKGQWISCTELSSWPTRLHEFSPFLSCHSQEFASHINAAILSSTVVSYLGWWTWHDDICFCANWLKWCWLGFAFFLSCICMVTCFCHIIFDWSYFNFLKLRLGVYTWVSGYAFGLCRVQIPQETLAAKKNFSTATDCVHTIVWWMLDSVYRHFTF